MTDHDVAEIKRIFLTRLDVLDHILDVGEKHLDDFEAAMQERLAPDMHPLGAQVPCACNLPRGFAQWCADQPIDNLPQEADSVAQAREHIRQTRTLVTDIHVDDDKLDTIKRIGLGHGNYCELPARQYVNDFLMPNFYFHITTAYAILRGLGVPLGKADFLAFLAPQVRTEGDAR